MRYSILVDLGKLKNLHTGLGQVSLQFGKALCDVDDDSLIMNFLIPKGFETRFDRSINFEYLSLKRRFTRFLCNKYDLWHTVHQDSAYFPSDSKTPYILTINDLNFLKEKSPPKARNRLRRLQKKVNRAAAIAVISRFTESVVRENLSIPDIPLEVIYYGIETKPVSVSRRPLFLPEGDFLFTIGLIKEKKNSMVLVDFMTELPDYKLIIAGDKSDPYARKTQDRIDSLRLQERIIMPGVITDEQKFWLYEHCRAFLFPSKYEGFGLPVIEAMRFGKPVFLSTCSSLPETGGRYAYYWQNFEVDHMKKVFLEKIKEFYRNKQNTADVKIYAEGFTWSKNVSSYIDLYKRVLTNSGRQLKSARI